MRDGLTTFGSKQFLTCAATLEGRCLGERRNDGEDAARGDA
jgi:hypothetical protein